MRVHVRIRLLRRELGSSRTQMSMYHLPSPLRRVVLSFRRLADSAASASPSSTSLFSSLSRWPRDGARCLLFPLAVAFGFDSSSDGGWDGWLLCLDVAAGDGEAVRWRLAPCLFLNHPSATNSRIKSIEVWEYARLALTSAPFAPPCGSFIWYAFGVLFAFLNCSSQLFLFIVSSIAAVHCGSPFGIHVTLAVS